MNIAIIKTGGKQYKVKEDDVLDVELLDAKKGDKIDLDDLLDGKKVKAQVLGSKKGVKITNLKFKNKTRYMRKIGHRQKYSSLKILEIK